jgi:hypothetical protein
MAEEKKEYFYVGIREPNEIRKGLLSCSKRTIAVLRKFEEFRSLRQEKVEAIIELKRVVRELALLTSKLKVLLPQTKLRAMGADKKKELEDTTRKITEHRRKAKQKEKSELEMLEKELSEIEARVS